MIHTSNNLCQKMPAGYVPHGLYTCSFTLTVMLSTSQDKSMIKSYFISPVLCQHDLYPEMVELIITKRAICYPDEFEVSGSIWVNIND